MPRMPRASRRHTTRSDPRSDGCRPAASPPEVPSSVHRSLGSSRVAYKAAATPCLGTQDPPATGRAVRRRQAGLPRRARIPSVLCPTAVPPPSLALAVARRLAPSSHRAAASLEQGSRRPPPGCAAVSPCQCDPDSNQVPKLVTGESLVILPTFPGRPAPPARRISAGTAAGRPGGPNCEPPVISRGSAAK
jgi:hypothetical protein